MSKPIENCPQPETPIRERAWTAEQVERAAENWETFGATDSPAMLRAYAATLRQQAERGGGEVSSEVVSKAWDVYLSCAEVGDQGMRAAIEAVAPLLRAPAERGGRVDGFEAWFGRNYPSTNDGANSGGSEESAIRNCARQAWQAALAQNAQVEDWRIGMFNRWRDRAQELGFAGIAEAVEAHAESAQNAQVGAVLEIGECAEVIWHQGGPCQLPPGAKLYLHAERARVPDGLIPILREASEVLANIQPDHAPSNMRWPLADELSGFAHILEDTAAPSQPEDAA